MEEIWKSIESYEGLYEISNYGRIKRFNKNKRFRAFKILKLYKRLDGHLEVALSKSGNEKKFLIHRLVLKAFVGPCPEDKEGCHNDGNPENNLIENLRWDTHRNNVQDSIKHNTINRGSKRPAAKLNEIKVKEIKKLLKEDQLTQMEISKIYNISAGVVSQIKNRKAWKHIKK